jgi:hypothetical protein
VPYFGKSLTVLEIHMLECLHFPPYYIHFEITDDIDPCNLIGSKQCDLIMNRTILAQNSIIFSADQIQTLN